MDQSTSLAAIQKLLEALIAKPDGMVIAALITVGGMVGVATLGGIVQWLVTRTVTRSEHERLRLQLKSESRLRQFEEWRVRLQETIVELLKETDPEVNPQVNRERVVPLILRAQVMLNVSQPAHRKLNGFITELGLAVNGWQGNRDVAGILRTHSAVLQATRELLALPADE